MLRLAVPRNDLARRSSGSVCANLALVAMGETVLRRVQIQILDGRRTLHDTQRNTSRTYHWRAFLGSVRCRGKTTFML